MAKKINTGYTFRFYNGMAKQERTIWSRECYDGTTEYFVRYGHSDCEIYRKPIFSGERLCFRGRGWVGGGDVIDSDGTKVKAEDFDDMRVIEK